MIRITLLLAASSLLATGCLPDLPPMVVSYDDTAVTDDTASDDSDTSGQDSDTDSGYANPEKGLRLHSFHAPDHDQDGVFDGVDNCPSVANADQADLDGDLEGDVCDNDDDNDGHFDDNDNCPLVENDQADTYGTSAGDACEDTDGDGLTDEQEISHHTNPLLNCEDNPTEYCDASVASVVVGGGATAAAFSCSMDTNGNVECTGIDDPSSDLGAFNSLSAGLDHVCGILDDGTGQISCWGENLPALDSEGYPNAGYTSVDVGGLLTCATYEVNSIRCWDENGVVDSGLSGQLVCSDGAEGFSYVCALDSAGRPSCASSSTVTEWNTGWDATPVDSTFMTDSLSCGREAACAISSTDGSVECWGYSWDTNGDDVNDASAHGTAVVPSSVSGTFSSVDAGYQANCAVREATGATECWGTDTAAPDIETSFLQVAVGTGGGCGVEDVNGHDLLTCWGAYL